MVSKNRSQSPQIGAVLRIVEPGCHDPRDESQSPQIGAVLRTMARYKWTDGAGKESQSPQIGAVLRTQMKEFTDRAKAVKSQSPQIGAVLRTRLSCEVHYRQRRRVSIPSNRGSTKNLRLACLQIP